MAMPVGKGLRSSDGSGADTPSGNVSTAGVGSARVRKQGQRCAPLATAAASAVALCAGAAIVLLKWKLRGGLNKGRPRPGVADCSAEGEEGQSATPKSGAADEEEDTGVREAANEGVDVTEAIVGKDGDDALLPPRKPSPPLPAPSTPEHKSLLPVARRAAEGSTAAATAALANLSPPPPATTNQPLQQSTDHQETASQGEVECPDKQDHSGTASGESADPVSAPAPTAHDEQASGASMAMTETVPPPETELSPPAPVEDQPVKMETDASVASPATVPNQTAENHPPAAPCSADPPSKAFDPLAEENTNAATTSSEVKEDVVEGGMSSAAATSLANLSPPPPAPNQPLQQSTDQETASQGEEERSDKQDHSGTASAESAEPVSAPAPTAHDEQASGASITLTETDAPPETGLPPPASVEDQPIETETDACLAPPAAVANQTAGNHPPAAPCSADPPSKAFDPLAEENTNAATASSEVKEDAVEGGMSSAADGPEDMWVAASHGDVEALREFLKHAHVDAMDEDGCSCLWLAANQGQLGVVRELIAHGADVNKMDREGASPLFTAANQAHVDVVRLLLGSGEVDVNARNAAGHTPLWTASNLGHTEVVRLLTQSDRVELNASDGNGRTALHAAANPGQAEVVKLLVGCEGVDVDAKDAEGNTPLAMVNWLLVMSGKRAKGKLPKKQLENWRACRQALITAGAQLSAAAAAEVVGTPLSQLAANKKKKKRAKSGSKAPKPNDPCTCGKHDPPRKYKKCCGAA